jgi:hypothetical protein
MVIQKLIRATPLRQPQLPSLSLSQRFTCLSGESIERSAWMLGIGIRGSTPRAAAPRAG